MEEYCVGKVSEMVFGYNITEKRNYCKFKESVLDLAIKMYKEPHRGFESVDEAVFSLMDNFYYDACLVLKNKNTIDELKDIWCESNSHLICV